MLYFKKKNIYEFKKFPSQKSPTFFTFFITIMENNQLYGTNLYGDEIASEEDDSEVFIQIFKVGSLIKTPYDDRNNHLSNSLNMIRKRCKKKITSIMFQGIDYTIFQDILTIDGMKDCAKEANKAVLNVLSDMIIYETQQTPTQKFKIDRGYYYTNTYTPGTTETESVIREVIVKGDIKVIPRLFLTLYKNGEPDYYDSIHGMQPETIDLSNSSVQEIGYQAFSIRGLKKVILPKHPVTAKSLNGYSLRNALGLDDSVVIENEEYLKDDFSGCCTLA